MLSHGGYQHQGGVDCVDLTATKSGFIHEVNARAVGMSVFRLGGGRLSETSAIDFGVGVQCMVRPGDPVQSGDVLARIFHRNETGLDDAINRLSRGFVIDRTGPAVPPLLHQVISSKVD